MGETREATADGKQVVALSCYECSPTSSPVFSFVVSFIERY